MPVKEQQQPGECAIKFPFDILWVALVLSQFTCSSIGPINTVCMGLQVATAINKFII